MKTKSFRFGTALVLGTLVLAVAGAVVPAQAQIDPIEPKDDAINDALAVPANPGAPSAATYTVLDNFLTGGPGPQWPGGYLPQGRDGDLYGWSYTGGITNNGSIWKTDPSGTVSVIYNFASGNECQNGMTLGTDGNFYGTADTNCTGGGYVFKITPTGTLTVLHTFTGTPDGYGPGPLTLYTDGNFYGVTGLGGANNVGSVFKITPTGTLTILYSFAANIGFDTPSYGLTVGNDGNFYGTTVNGNGTVFKMTPSGVVTVLHTFTGFPDAFFPATGVILGKDGNFYGNTQYGGTQNVGTIFKMTPSGTLTILHSFNQPSDYATNPTAPLLQATDGNFYSAADSCTQFGCGAQDLYEMTPSGTLTVLQEFTASYPYWSLIQDTNGIMYGVTQQGGTVNGGVLFSLNIGAAPFASLVSTSGKEGAKIGILGQGFSSSSVVKFGGVQATTIARSGTTFINATVPAGALTAAVTVTTGATTLTSPQTFKVTPTFPSFNPTSGPVGTPVVLTGTGLTQTTKVTFGGVKATTVTVNSDTQVTANVPTGARTGKIVITTLGGSATSTTNFTVN
ncbi:MAG: hypothetical protein DME59_09545 [Verrucomicrobia bacterium]|nr:MAG: hypothetical protein DME59_09545 [Verrucomicrobiota bacterium]